MKTWKFLSVPLMLMLLSGMPWSDAFAAEDTTEPVVVGSGEHRTAGNVTVKDEENAVSVTAEEGEASAKIEGNVTLTGEAGSPGDMSAVRTEGINSGKAHADVNGDISVSSDEKSVYGIRAEGSYGNEGTSFVTSNNVSAKSTTNTSRGAWIAGSQAKINGDITSEGSDSLGIGAFARKPVTNVDVAGSVNVKAKDYAIGTMLMADPEGTPDGDILINIKKDLTATVTEGDNDNQNSTGISLLNIAKNNNFSVDIGGNVRVESPNGYATGIDSNSMAPELVSSYGEITGPGKSIIHIQGDLVSNDIGISRTLVGNGKDDNLDIIVEGTIDAKNLGIRINKPYIPETGDNEDVPPQSTLNLTVWKIKPNQNGNVAEMLNNAMAIVPGYPDGVVPPDAPQQDPSENNPIIPATDFEKKIMYIIKVEQPGAGGTIKATDANGNDLAKSFDFDVAHEGDKVLLKANLQEGYKIVAAYNGLGEKQALLQDENGNYYIVVPKGGGVYLSVELEDTTEHYQADNDEDVESITDNPEEETETEKSNDTEPVSVSATASKSSSKALKTGDISQVAPWLILSVVSTGGIAGLEISKKKDKSEK